jgi:hypothetical protein
MNISSDSKHFILVVHTHGFIWKRIPYTICLIGIFWLLLPLVFCFIMVYLFLGLNSGFSWPIYSSYYNLSPSSLPHPYPSQETYNTRLADTPISSRLRNVQAWGENFNRYIEAAFAEQHWLLTWAHKLTKNSRFLDISVSILYLWNIHLVATLESRKNRTW